MQLRLSRLDSSGYTSSSRHMRHIAILLCFLFLLNVMAAFVLIYMSTLNEEDPIKDDLLIAAAATWLTVSRVCGLH